MASGAGAGSASRLVLDASAYSRFRAGDPLVHDFIAAAEVVFVPTTVLGELHATFELGSRARENQVTLAEFLAEPFVVVLPLSATIAQQYGRIFATLQGAGTPIPANDIWIAAATIDQGATLLTFDQDFERVPGLERIVLEGIETS